MLDNDEFIKDPFSRELTQNPLKKIWMPYKNGHISHRRGKTQPAGQQPDREAIYFGISVTLLSSIQTYPYILDFTNYAPKKDRSLLYFGSFASKSLPVCVEGIFALVWSDINAQKEWKHQRWSLRAAVVRRSAFAESSSAAALV